MSELGPEARAVVEAGRAGDEATPGDRARIRAALMATIASGGAGAASMLAEGSATAAAAKGTALAGAAELGLGWKVLAAGLAVVGTLATVITVARGPEGFSAAGAVPSMAQTPLAPAMAKPVPTAALPTLRELPVAATAARSAARPPASSPHAGEAEPIAPEPAAPATAAPAPTASPAPDDSLEAETRHLGEAHGALKDGDPARALALLDEQSATYQTGQLREERAAARILALCKLGRVDEAKALAARFLAESPRSPLADRVRAACATSPSP